MLFTRTMTCWTSAWTCMAYQRMSSCYVRPVYHCCCISHPNGLILTLVPSCSWKAVCWLAISSTGLNIAAIQRIFPLVVHNHGVGGSDTLPTIHSRFSTSQVEKISCFQLWHYATDMPGYTLYVWQNRRENMPKFQKWCISFKSDAKPGKTCTVASS